MMQPSFIGVGLASLLLVPLAIGQSTSPVTPTPPPSSTPAATAPARVVAPAPSQEALAAAADYSAERHGRAMLVMHDGKVIFERYDNGWAADRPHPLASGTKSFVGVIAMFAVQDGLITLDEKASDTITDWQSDPARSQITLRHLLTLSSGLDPADATLGTRGGSRVLGPGRNTAADRERGSRAAADRYEAILETEMSSKRGPGGKAATPGGQFEYGSSHFYALSLVIDRKLKASDLEWKTTQDYFEGRVAQPIGMDVARLGVDRGGAPNFAGGAMLTAREWAKFGQFVLQHGSWTNEKGKSVQLLKPELLQQCFVPSEANPAYGLTWWLLDAARAAAAESSEVADGGGSIRERLRDRAFAREVGFAKDMVGPDGKPLKVLMAAGLGKQRLFVIPQHNLVIVRFAENAAPTPGVKDFSNAEFLGKALGTGH
jgi:CubicO group peptidase (beta-lactamase class C family)